MFTKQIFAAGFGNASFSEAVVWRVVAVSERSAVFNMHPCPHSDLFLLHKRFDAGSKDLQKLDIKLYRAGYKAGVESRE